MSALLQQSVFKAKIDEKSHVFWDIDFGSILAHGSDSENNEKQLTYAEAEKLVTEELLEKLKIKNTKLKSVKNFKETNKDSFYFSWSKHSW